MMVSLTSWNTKNCCSLLTFSCLISKWTIPVKCITFWLSYLNLEAWVRVYLRHSVLLVFSWINSCSLANLLARCLCLKWPINVMNVTYHRQTILLLTKSLSKTLASGQTSRELGNAFYMCVNVQGRTLMWMVLIWALKFIRKVKRKWWMSSISCRFVIPLEKWRQHWLLFTTNTMS